MIEFKIAVEAKELSEAINNLASAISGKAPHTVCNQYGTNGHCIDNVGTINAGVGGKAQPAAPTAPVNLAPAPAATPTQEPGAPLSTTTTQTATQIAPVVTPAANAAPVPTVPTSAPQYTLEMIATAGSTLIDAGKINQLMQLLGKFGVASLTELAPESYGAVANELRALGASI